MELLAGAPISSCQECVATLALPLGLFLLLSQTAAGGIATVAFLRRTGGLTPGFLKFVAATYCVLAALALLVVWAAPPANYRQLLPILEPAARALLPAQGLLLIGLLVLTVMLWQGKEAAGAWIGVLSSAALMLALTAATFSSFGGTLITGLAVVLAVLVSPVVLGSATTGMLLGHWYLVTPALTNRPLLRSIALLLVALLLQAVLLPLAVAGVAHKAPFQALGFSPVLAWLWALGAVLLPLLAAVPAWATCRIRSFMSTTGLLYLAMIALLPGQLLGQLLLMVAAAA